MLSRLAIFLLLFAATGQAKACLCEDDVRPAEDRVGQLFASHDVVGVFEVAGWRSGRETFDSVTESGRWVVLQPIHLFKGPSTSLLSRAAPRLFASDCDIKLLKSEFVLVYAHSDAAVPMRFCSASGPLRSRMRELGVLFRHHPGGS